MTDADEHDTETDVEGDGNAGRPRRRWPRRLLYAACGVVALALVASNVMLWMRAEDAHTELTVVRREANRTRDVECGGYGYRGPSICSDIDDAATSADYALSRADDLEGQIADVIRCVNAYMDTVADARGGSYRYRRC